jgi:hypothetical protein
LIYVFFCNAASRAPSARVALRKWTVYRHAKISRWLKHLSGDPVHCAVGHERSGVLDTNAHGHALYDFDEWVSKYPTLDGWFEVPTAGVALDLRPFTRDHRLPVLFDAGLIATWLTRGAFRTEDCVAVTLRILQSHHVPAPSHLWTPRQVYNWLYERGYPYSVARRSVLA